MGYKKLLDEARKLKKKIPPMPKLSEREIVTCSERYIAFAEAYSDLAYENCEL